MKTDQDAEKIRLLVSGHLPPPMGGVGTYYQALLSSSLSHQVDLCFVQTSSQRRTLSESGRFTFTNLISAAQDCGRFTRAVWVHRPQVSHISTAFGLSFVKHSICICVARLMGSRVLLHPHCSLALLYTERPGWWQWLFRRIINLTNGVVALSSEWLRLRSIVPTCPVYYLPNAIDLTPYCPIAQGRLARGQNNGSLRILYLGYLGRAKGTFDLIEAARLALAAGANLSFDLVGDELTPGEGRLVRECVDDARLNGTVRVHPPAHGAEKLAFFRDADVFIYPSYYEGMPMAVLEAMACGLPIVATNVGGLPDLVHDNINGILVPPRRPAQLAAALHQLASDGPARQAMQLKSFQFASEQYDMEKHVAQLVNIYRAALSCRELQVARS